MISKTSKHFENDNNAWKFQRNEKSQAGLAATADQIRISVKLDIVLCCISLKDYVYLYICIMYISEVIIQFQL